MHFTRLLVAIALSGCVLFSPTKASDFSEIWVGLESDRGVVQRLSDDGQLISSFTAGSPILDIVQVNNEVWVGRANNTRLDQYDTLGTLLTGSVATGGFPNDMEVVTDEVWIVADRQPGLVERFDTDGNFLSNIEPGNPRATDVATVGTEVWVGFETDRGLIQRYNRDGQLLGAFTAGDRINGMLQVGDEVWVGLGNPTVRRFDNTGTLLGSFTTGGFVADMVQVDDEIWVGRQISTGLIERYDFDGNFISDITVGQRIVEMAAISVVPEPVSASQFLAVFFLLGQRRIPPKWVLNAS